MDADGDAAAPVSHLVSALHARDLPPRVLGAHRELRRGLMPQLDAIDTRLARQARSLEWLRKHESAEEEAPRRAAG